ncbi:MAG: metal ABC transporter permease [Chloroflexales bacterium]|nr:metal ABC transporter permease [Chloroflexales bacterium]
MSELWQWLTAPFAYQFMQNALLASLLIAATCGIIGSYVVLRRMAFIGDALAHTALPGVVIAYMNGWSLVGGALAAGIMTALGIGWMARKSNLREDTAIGVIFTAMFALGILLMSRLQSFRDLSHILFGNILGVQSQELWLMSGVALVVLVVLILFHKELELTSFDSTHAEVIGIQSNHLRTMLLILLAFTVVTGIQVVGVVLTSALLVTPAAAASLITSDLRRMMAVSAVIGAGSAFVGLLLSYYFAVSTGAAIVLTCTAVFGIIVFFNWITRRRIR